MNNKKKIDELDFMKIKTFVHQGHYQGCEKTPYRVGENICELHIQ